MITDFLTRLLASSDFYPHGYCYLWDKGLVWLNVVSDTLIALAYFAIPIILLWFIFKRRDLPFSWMFLLFGVFIVACGMTHVMEVWNLWHAQYWLAGAIKAITAAASLPTAVLLAQLIPKAIKVPSVEQWIRANAALEQEVHERRELELDLRTSEARFRDIAELLDLTHDAIYTRNLNDEIVFWNRAAERLYGWQKEEVRGKSPHHLLRTVFPKPIEEIRAQVLDKGSWEGELVHKRRDGGEVIVFSRWALRTDINGKPTAVLESNRDITQRRGEEAKFRKLLEAAPDAMVITNQAGMIQLVNTQTETLFGYPRQEILGQPVEVLIPHRFRDRHMAYRRDYSALPHARAMGEGLELFGRRKDGSEFPVEVSLSPIETYEEGLIASAIRDATQRKQIQERLEEQRKQLARSNIELVETNRELESFSYSVSHDLRAPLRAIDGFSAALMEDCEPQLDEAGKDHLKRIRAATQRMGNLIDDLLNLSRITRGEMHMKTVDISALVRAVSQGMNEAHPGRKVKFTIEDGLKAEADQNLLRVALENLLGNSWKFTSKRPAAHIEFGKTDFNCVPAYYVRDDGAGFDPFYAQNLFGAFQRLHAASEFPGTGIGLATVQRIIRRHGGRIWAEGAVDKGATFYFTLAEKLV
jgi:PAS domain S-box-containing protein